MQQIELILKKIETVSGQEIDHWVDQYEEAIEHLPEAEIDRYEERYDSILLKRMTNIWADVADTEHLLQDPVEKPATKSKGILYTLFLWLIKGRRHPAQYNY